MANDKIDGGVLTQADLEQFGEQGFLVVRDCVPQSTACQAREAIWADLVSQHNVADDPVTWQGQYFNPAAKLLKGWQMPSARMRLVLDALLGEDTWRTDHQSNSCGTVFASLPHSNEVDTWTVSGEWHWDQGENRHLPSYTGLQACTLLTDAEHQDGGTLFVSGSHHIVAEHFHRTRGSFSDNYSAARMRSFFATEEWFRDLDSGAVPKQERVATYMNQISEVNGVQLQVHEMTGKTGDAYFLHPLLVHAGPPNGGHTPRMMHRAFAWCPQATN